MQLEDMLARAQVGETPKDDGVVDAGMEVTVRFGGDDETETFLLGAREVLALDANVDLSVYSPQSPLGAAILGKQAGRLGELHGTERPPDVGRDRRSQAVHRRPLTSRETTKAPPRGHKSTRDRAQTNPRQGTNERRALPTSRGVAVRRP